MSIRYKLLIAFSIVVLLAAAAAAYAIHVVSGASTLVVQLYDGPLMAVSQARSAQVHFNEARRAMETGIILREAAPASNTKAIETAMKQFAADLKVVKERMPDASVNQEIDKVLSLADDWFKMGLGHIKPPASGLTALPLPAAVFAKGNEVTNAIDLIVEAASAYGFDFRSQAESSAASSWTNILIVTAAVVLVGVLLAFGMAYS